MFSQQDFYVRLWCSCFYCDSVVKHHIILFNRLHTNTGGEDEAYFRSLSGSGLIILRCVCSVGPLMIDNRGQTWLGLRYLLKLYLMQWIVLKTSDCVRHRLQRTDTDLHRRAWKVKACIIEKWDLKILRMWKFKRWPSKPSYGNTFSKRANGGDWVKCEAYWLVSAFCCSHIMTSGIYQLISAVKVKFEALTHIIHFLKSLYFSPWGALIMLVEKGHSLPFLSIKWHLKSATKYHSK